LIFDRYHSIRCTSSPVFYIDGKIRAEQGTQTAIGAMKIVDNFGGVIPFRISVLGYRQHISGTELDTKTASFTAVIDDVNDTVCNPDAI
jgi:hypothetical protein